MVFWLFNFKKMILYKLYIIGKQKLKWKDYVYSFLIMLKSTIFEHIVEEYYDDIFMDLNDMKVMMFEILDKTKITHLEIYVKMFLFDVIYLLELLILVILVIFLNLYQFQ